MTPVGVQVSFLPEPADKDLPDRKSTLIPMRNANNTLLSNDVNEKESLTQSTSPSRLSVMSQVEVGLHQTTGRRRQANQCTSFTSENNMKIVACFYHSEPAMTGYMVRMIGIREEQRGLKLTENRLAMQARTIIKKWWFIAEDLYEIRVRKT